MLAVWAHWMHGADQRSTAKARFAQYVETVHLQHDRVVNPGQRHSGFGSLDEQRQADMLQYIAAARQVRRAAGSLWRLYPQELALRQAISAFDRSAPLIKDFRDLFEHFDEYDKGVGNMQKKGALPTSRLAEKYAFSSTDATVEAYGQTISAAATTPAVDALAKAVLALNLPDSGW